MCIPTILYPFYKTKHLYKFIIENKNIRLFTNRVKLFLILINSYYITQYYALEL